MIKKLTAQEISEKYNYTPARISAWAKREGLVPSRIGRGKAVYSFSPLQLDKMLKAFSAKDRHINLYSPVEGEIKGDQWKGTTSHQWLFKKKKYS